MSYLCISILKMTKIEDEETLNSGEVDKESAKKQSNSDIITNYHKIDSTTTNQINTEGIKKVTIDVTHVLPKANTNEIKEAMIDPNNFLPVEMDKISINIDTMTSHHLIGGITANQTDTNGIKEATIDEASVLPVEMATSHHEISDMAANQTNPEGIHEAKINVPNVHQVVMENNSSNSDATPSTHRSGGIPTNQNNTDRIQETTINVPNALPVEIDGNSRIIDSTLSHHELERTTANQTDTDGIQEPMIDVTNVHPLVIDDNSSNPLQIQVRLSQQNHCPSGALAYPMKSNPRGNVLIINNIEFADKNHKPRFGGQVDSANLKSLFSQLGFEVTVYHNLSQRAMRKKIIEHSELDIHYQADMGVVCLLSHGEETDKMRSCDGEIIDLEWVYRKYRSDSCPSLHGKPKLFLIQACRGDDHNASLDLEDESFIAGAKRKTETSTDTGSTKVPNGEDILIVNSTVPSFVAHRDTKRGSWLIECFCEVVMENAFNTDLRDMLDMVAEKLRGPKYEDNEGNKQIFEHSNRHFRKKLFFNPGLYEDEIKQRKDSVKEITIRTEPKTTFNKENEILTKFYSDKDKVLESLKRLLKVFRSDTITVDHFSDSGISNTLYNTIRLNYNVETQQGRKCRMILKKMQSVVKSDSDYEDEDLPPITPLPDAKKDGRSLFIPKKDQA